MGQADTGRIERHIDGHDDVDPHVSLSRRVLAVAAALVVIHAVVQFMLGASPLLLLAWPIVDDHEAVLSGVVTVGYAVTFGLAAVVAVGVRFRPCGWAIGAMIVGRLVVVDVIVYLACVAAWVLLARSSVPAAVAMLLFVVVPNVLLLGAGVTIARRAREVIDDPDTPSRGGPRRPLDRTRDLRSWALAPLAALPGAPLLAAVVMGDRLPL